MNKNLNFYLLIFISIFSIVINDKIKIKTLAESYLSLIKCMIDSGVLDDETINKLNNLSQNMQLEEMEEISSIIIKNRDKIASCLLKSDLMNKFMNIDKDINYNEMFEKRYNWENYLRCLKKEIERIESGDEMNELIKAIEQNDFMEAMKIENQLRLVQNKIIKKCYKSKSN